MADKVNMSLDEIIRVSKARRTAGEASGGRKTMPKKQGARLSTGRARAAGRPGAMRTNFTKKIVKKAVINQRNAARRNINTNAGGGMIPRNEVKNIVNKAVKQAIKQSNANIGVLGKLGGKIPRNIITASRLAQLTGRSPRTIARNRIAPVMRQRGRGFAPAQPAVQYVQEVVSPQPQQVRIIRQPVQAPVVQVVERIVPARQQIRKFAPRGGIARQQQQIARVGGGGRIIRQQPVIVQRARPQQQMQRVVQVQRPAQRVIQQQRIVQRPAIQQRVQRQQVIYEQAPQRVQVVRRQAPVQQQRVQVIRQNAPAPRGRGQNVQYVEYTSAGPANAARNKNNRMRDALGLGNSRQVVRQAQRFEPSSSFLTDRTISNVRGRGFAGGRSAAW